MIRDRIRAFFESDYTGAAIAIGMIGIGLSMLADITKRAQAQHQEATAQLGIIERRISTRRQLLDDLIDATKKVTERAVYGDPPAQPADEPNGADLSVSPGYRPKPRDGADAKADPQ